VEQAYALDGLISVADNQGNTYLQAEVATSGTSARAYIYYAKNIAASGTFTVTVTFAGTTYFAAGASEWSGADTAAPLDDTNANTGTGTAISTGNLTPTGNALYVGCCAAGDPWDMTGLAADQTSIHNQPSNAICSAGMAYRTGSGSLPVTWTMTGSGDWCAAGATFKEAEAGESFTLSAAGGSFTWGVVAAALLRGFVLQAEAAHTPTAPYTASLEPAAYTQTASDAALLRGFVLQAEAEHPAGAAYTLGLEPASYTLTGEESTSFLDYNIGANGDTLALTGGAAATTKTVGFTASPAEYTLTGEAGALSKVNLLAAIGATISETGGAAGTYMGRLSVAEAVEFIQTGTEITAKKSWSTFTDVGTFLEYGQAVEMISPETLTPDERSFIWVG
jgi:hypothetical protein